MDRWKNTGLLLTRRHFFVLNAAGLGTAVLATLLGEDLLRAESATNEAPADRPFPGLPGLPHFPPKAKRVIWLFQYGGPSQMDLVDYKPGVRARRGQELPASMRMGQRQTGMTVTQDTLPVAAASLK